MIPTEIRAIAEKFGVDARSLNDMLEYLKGVIESSPAARIAFLSFPGEFIKHGAQHWINMRFTALNELLENKTEWSRQVREQCAAALDSGN